MNILSVENISKHFGEKLIFEGISFGIDQGQKVALIARNGTGKTTLLEILAGNNPPDSGLVTYRNNIRIGYLPQDPIFERGSTILESVFYGDQEEVIATKNYERAIAQGGKYYQTALDKMDALNAWDFETRARQILSNLDLLEFEEKVETLSGGEKKRVALARELIKSPDFLILDEPTNHLDLKMIEWLEKFLGQTNTTLFMVTHDRYFLDRICDEILELEDGTIYRYKGGYGYFLEKKELREQVQLSNTLKAQGLMKTELEWMRRQPKARGTKAKYRIDAFEDIKDRASNLRKEEKLELKINVSRIGTKIVELHKVSKSFPKKTILNQFSYVFKRNERIGIVGENGCGKSTLLKLITGIEEPEGGKIVIGDTVKFGYYTQDGISFNEGEKVIEAVRKIADVIPLTKGQKLTAAQMLERFLFPRKMHFNQINTLSGGEKKRLYLLTVLMCNPNFIILDEPTNDLDIFTLNVLEDYLESFEGSVIVVSHDRFFLDKIVDHLFVFQENGQIKDFPGTYTQYRNSSSYNAKVKAEKPIALKQEKKPDTNKKITYAERLELEKLDKEIPLLEALLKEKSSELNLLSDYNKIQEISVEVSMLNEKLETKSMRWLELTEKKEDG